MILWIHILCGFSRLLNSNECTEVCCSITTGSVLTRIYSTLCSINGWNSLEFDVLTSVVMKRPIFWDITQCSPLKDSRRFEGTCRIFLQGRRISQARNLHEVRSKQNEWSRWGRNFPPKRRFSFNRLHSVVLQKI
jgi:hypothetical protein